MPTTQHLPHPLKAPDRQHVPQLFPLAPQLMDQIHPSGDQAHEGGFLRRGIARGQLPVEPLVGVGGYSGAVEKRGGQDGHGCIKGSKDAGYRSRWVCLLFL